MILAAATGCQGVAVQVNDHLGAILKLHILAGNVYLADSLAVVGHINVGIGSVRSAGIGLPVHILITVLTVADMTLLVGVLVPDVDPLYLTGLIGVEDSAVTQTQLDLAAEGLCVGADIVSLVVLSQLEADLVAYIGCRGYVPVS